MIPTLEQQIDALWWLLTVRGYSKGFHAPGEQDVRHKVIVSANDYGIQLGRAADSTAFTMRGNTREELLSAVIAFRVAERLT